MDINSFHIEDEELILPQTNIDRVQMEKLISLDPVYCISATPVRKSDKDVFHLIHWLFNKEGPLSP